MRKRSGPPPATGPTGTVLATATADALGAPVRVGVRDGEGEAAVTVGVGVRVAAAPDAAPVGLGAEDPVAAGVGAVGTGDAVALTDAQMTGVTPGGAAHTVRPAWIQASGNRANRSLSKRSSPPMVGT